MISMDTILDEGRSIAHKSPTTSSKACALPGNPPFEAYAKNRKSAFLNDVNSRSKQG
jgi:hypothetical protein